jgi:putative redox protein
MHTEVAFEQNSRFSAKVREHSFVMDTKKSAGGDDLGPSPKELLLTSILGCTGMDVIALLKKHRITPTKFKISAQAEPQTEHPRIFPSINLVFDLEDPSLTPEIASDSIQKSLTKYCGVSAMVYKTSPIYYEIILNGEEVGRGHADFGL